MIKGIFSGLGRLSDFLLPFGMRFVTLSIRQRVASTSQTSVFSFTFRRMPDLMKTRFNSFAAAALLMAVAVGGSQTSLRADVVFGNLGPTGSLGISSTQTDFGPGSATTAALAQGFTTGVASTDLQLQSVTIGAFATSVGTLPRTISIYSNSSNAPGSPVFTSAPTEVGNNAKYTFNFTSATLSANTSYWVVPDFSVPWTWVFEATDFTPPSQQNSSGYSYLGSSRIQNTAPGVWAPGPTAYSISVSAVPEPGTVGLAIAGLAACGLAFARRRMAG
jgi:hypothetical protein